MPRVVMLVCNLLARLQLDAERGQYVNLREHAGPWLEVERAAFTLDARVEKCVALRGQSRVQIAGDADDERTIAFERTDGSFHLAHLATVGDDNHDIAWDDLSGAAVHALGAV